MSAGRVSSLLAVKKKPQENSTGWLVVVETTGEVILSTSWGLTRTKDKPYEVYVPWPGFRKDLRVADEEASLRLAEKVHARILQRLGVPS